MTVAGCSNAEALSSSTIFARLIEALSSASIFLFCAAVSGLATPDPFFFFPGDGGGAASDLWINLFCLADSSSSASWKSFPILLLKLDAAESSARSCSSIT